MLTYDKWFFIVAALQIVGEAIRWAPLCALKPIPIILLCLWMNNPQGQLQKFFLVSLMASMVGDVLLMSSEFKMFQLGTIYFLVAHLGNVAGMISQMPKIIFKKDSVDAKNTTSSALSVRLLQTCIIVVYIANIAFLWDKWSGLSQKLLFTTYGLSLNLMILSAIEFEWRIKLHTITEKFPYLLIGAVLFGASDSILAFLKFLEPNDLLKSVGRIVVMLTYYLAQYGITKGGLTVLNAKKPLLQNQQSASS